MTYGGQTSLIVALESFLRAVAALGYAEQPDYNHLESLLAALGKSLASQGTASVNGSSRSQAAASNGGERQSPRKTTPASRGRRAAPKKVGFPWLGY